jgi:hypothetical protein
MKKINLLILPILALAMVGCSKGEVSSTGNPTTEPKTSQKASDEKTSSTKTSSTKTSSSGKVSSTSSSGKVSSSSSETETPDSSSQGGDTSSSVDVYSIGWKKDVVDMMLKYLGGTVVPYIYLGPSKKVFASYEVKSTDYGTLTISGNKEWDSDTLTDAISSFTTAGWTTPYSASTKLIAYDPTQKVKVIMSTVSAADQTIVLEASYEEDYDLSKATDSWDSEITQLFMDTFSAVPTYVYLGTAAPTAAMNAAGDAVVVTGGRWNQQVLIDAKTTLTDAGYTVTQDSTNGLLATGVKMSASSQDEFSIKIHSETSSTNKICMEVSKKTISGKDSFTAWPQNIQDQFNTYCGGHSIPVIYMGTNTPAYSYYSSSAELDIRGKAWDDDIVNETKTSWVNDGWTLTNDNLSASYNPSLTYTKTFSDNCTLKASIIHNSYYGMLIEVYYTEGIAIPDTAKNWSTDTTNLMSKNFGSTLPYIYLGTTTETATYSDFVMTITGGEWKKAYGTYFDSVYGAITDDDDNKVWTVSVTSYTGYATATATIGENKYKISLQKDSSGNVCMTITFIPPYSVPEDCTAWEEEITQQFTEKLHGHEIPYVYLKAENPTVDTNTNSNTVTINGGIWDEQMITVAKTNFADKGWTVQKETAATASSTGSIEFTKDFGDGCKLTATLREKSSSTNTAQLVIVPNEYYSSVSVPTEWSNTTKSAFASFGEELPYVYLGTRYDKGTYSANTSSYYTYTDRVTITGVGWSDEIITDAKTTFEKKGWSTIESKNSYGKVLIAYKYDTTNDVTTTAVIQKNNSRAPELTAYKSTYDSTLTSEGTYSEDFKTALKTYSNDDSLASEMTYLSLGDTLTTSQSASNHYLTVRGNEKLNPQRAIVIYNQLKAANWDVSMYDSSSVMMIKAEKSLTNGAKITIELSNSNGCYMMLNYYPAFNQPETASWTSATSAKITKKLGHCLPAFYIGSDDPTCTEYGSYITLSGERWDDAIYTNLIKALEADTENTWTYCYDYSGSNTKLVASTTYADGKKATIKVYKQSELPTVEYYVK